MDIVLDPVDVGAAEVDYEPMETDSKVVKGGWSS